MLHPKVSIFFLLFLSGLTLSHQAHFPSNELVVRANSGTYKGITTEAAPHVRQFLQIPYALPPIGSRRWLPPVKPFSNASSAYDATTFPPSCPQYRSKVPSLQSQDSPEFQIFANGQSPTVGASAANTSEDCLYLAVWTPAGVKTSNLPVIMFMTGGGFETGGINILAQLPHHWVERTQAHIVITVNYRLNIMGFPNAAGLETQNIGLLDQRMALEWVRDNIADFGGDSSKIMLWGQSAGADSVDYQNFAFHTDPIASIFYMSSGSAYQMPITDPHHKNFSFVASHFGCAGPQEVDCMRAVPSDDMQNFIGHHMDTYSLIDPTLEPLYFIASPDDVLVFSNYTDRYEKGLVSNRPAIVSTTTNEGVDAIPYPGTPSSHTAAGQPPNQAIVDYATRQYFLCPAVKTSVLRSKLNLTTYRMLYAGNFSNVSPQPWFGAYHLSDLPSVFGTYEDFPGRITPEQVAVSESMQNYILSLMLDLPPRLGDLVWPSYEQGIALAFGLNGSVVQRVDVGDIDDVCGIF